MPECSVRPLVDRLVQQAGVPGSAGRDLRDELLAHFEDAVLAHGSVDAARDAFGSDDEIAASLCAVYAGARARWQAARLVTALLSSAAVTLVIELVVAQVNLGAGPTTWRMPDWRPAALGLVVAVGAVVAWELARPPVRRGRVFGAIAAYGAALVTLHQVSQPLAHALDTAALVIALAALCGMLRSRAARFTARLVAFAALLYLLHVGQPYAFSPSRALAAGGVLAIVWMATLTTLAQIDDAFGGPFGGTSTTTWTTAPSRLR